MKILGQLISLISLFAVLLMFQNCSDVEFNGVGVSKLDKGELVVGEDLPIVEQENNEDLGDGSSQNNTEEGGSSNTNTAENNSSSEDHDHGSCKDDDKKGSHFQSVELAKCRVLNRGNGRALSIHLVDGDLAFDTQTPKLLCMSKLACEELVANALGVKTEAVRFQPCQSNKHVERATDAEIVALLSK